MSGNLWSSNYENKRPGTHRDKDRIRKREDTFNKRGILSAPKATRRIY